MEKAQRVVCVTGAGSGVGEAIAQIFLEEGEQVILVGRRASPLNKIAQKFPKNSTVFECDVSKKSETRALAQKVLEKFGRCDILINNAGIAISGGIETLTEEDWDAQMNINAKGAFLTVQSFLPLLKEGTSASIVNIASNAAVKGIPQLLAYGASKAALVSFTQTLALELAPLGIRANCVSPGALSHSMHAPDGSPLPKEAEDRRNVEIARHHPLGRLGTPGEIASAVVFLCRPQSAWTTGQNIVIDGGFSI